MSLTGLQHQQLQSALLAAFDEAGLRLLARQELDVELETVAGGRNRKEIVLNLIAWAEHEQRVADLIAGAPRQNPTNPDLVALAEAARTWHLEAPAPAEDSPYKGLEFYDVVDAPLFFGRQALTAELVAYLKEHRFLAVVGASGSGKSSVVRAGVVAALQQGDQIHGSDRWQTVIITPTARPLETVALALALPGEDEDAISRFKQALRERDDALHLRGRRLLAATGKPHLVLVIDQFEELFTLCKEPAERRAFVDNLLEAAAGDGMTTVVLTLRADFYARCAEFANLRLAVSQHQSYIGPMTPEELREVIERPASAGGWDLESGLTNRLLKDVAGEPGSLPLLSHALLETWKRRSGRTLTLAGYEAAGGVEGAIAHTADALYGELATDDQRALVRNIFVRLTSLGEGAQDTRRRVELDELAGGTQAAEVQAVLKQLQDARLVTAERDAQGEVYVNVVHEAIIREWPLLRRWLDDDREGHRIHRRLTEAEQEWDALKRDPGVLLRGALLAQTVEWAAGHPDALNDKERTFLETSQAEVARERGEREAARQRELQQAKRARNRSRLALGAASVGLVLAVAVAWLLYQQVQALRGEQLLAEARQLREALDAPGAVAKYTEAVATDPELDFDLSTAISDTLRYVATRYVQEGERVLCEASSAEPGNCILPDTEPSGEQIGASIVISPAYLAWAEATAPLLVGWSPDVPPVQQQAVISATALYSQALALNPPPGTPVYVWIAPGRFEMGSTDEQCQKAGLDNCEGFPDEQPAHPVELDGYWIQRTEVTNAQYKRCVDAGACGPPANLFWEKPRSALLPVTGVDWNQAVTYAAWVGGRLPTEAEWEYACRSADGRIWPWGNDRPATDRLNYNMEIYATTEVGTYPSWANGLYDMAGNVLEWTADWYDSGYYDNSPERNPTGPEEGEFGSRTLRGGAWLSNVKYVRCAYRLNFNPDYWYVNVGFRLLSPGSWNR